MINFPYSNLHQLDLDWILSEVKKSSNIVNDIKDRVGDIAESEIDEWIKNNLAQLLLSAFYDPEKETITLKTNVNYPKIKRDRNKLCIQI